jgi:hypothetical protein
VGKQLGVDTLRLYISSTVTRDDDGELSCSRQPPPPRRRDNSSKSSLTG